MGFFRNLWDEALAGSTSDSGVGKLRRYNSLLSRSDNPPTGDSTPVSRSITILRTNSLSGSSASGSTPSSPTGSGSAGSPLSGNSSFIYIELVLCPALDRIFLNQLKK
ncbi:putative dormancy/auxin associated protein [Helianthus annuus]|nr:putative dormancy/auxin associated protein [Helianthus annuus]